MRKPRCTNWRVTRISDEQVVAIEPSRDYETVFEGGKDPFQEALEFAAEELRKVLTADA